MAIQLSQSPKYIAFYFWPGFGSRRRHGCLQMYSAVAAWGRRPASPLEEERCEAPDSLSQNWGETELNRRCSRPRLTIGVHLVLP
ncbi:hypothetical protein TNCV_779821 [Trichonephila clavipes]|nr:hypothetical protein TNCV_779821 [Trichonephila clavipes]